MEKFVKELRNLGLTSKEAHIYVFFAKNGSDKREEVINQLEIGEQELTVNLEGLTRKGFVEIDPEDSNVFSVVPLQVVVERLIKEKLREVQEIRGEIRDYGIP